MKPTRDPLEIHPQTRMTIQYRLAPLTIARCPVIIFSLPGLCTIVLPNSRNAIEHTALHSNSRGFRLINNGLSLPGYPRGYSSFTGDIFRRKQLPVRVDESSGSLDQNEFNDLSRGISPARCYHKLQRDLEYYRPAHRRLRV